MRRARWLLLGVLLAAGGAKLMAEMPTPVLFDPARSWQRRSEGALEQYHASLSVSERKARLDWEAAAEDRRVALTHAAHERAMAAWLAIETYRRSARDAAARTAYGGAITAANQQYSQAVGVAQKTWTQALTQPVQTCQQEQTAALAAAEADLTAATTLFTQSAPTFEGDPEVSAWESWLLPGAPAGDAWTAADNAFAETVNQARAKYRTALQEATAAWQQSTQQAAQKLAKRELADEMVVPQLRKANRLWSSAAQDLVADLRARFRSALRTYEATTLPG